MNKRLPSYFINESFYNPKKLFIWSNMFLLPFIIDCSGSGSSFAWLLLISASLPTSSSLSTLESSSASLSSEDSTSRRLFDLLQTHLCSFIAALVK